MSHKLETPMDAIDEAGRRQDMHPHLKNNGIPYAIMFGSWFHSNPGNPMSPEEMLRQHSAAVRRELEKREP